MNLCARNHLLVWGIQKKGNGLILNMGINHYKSCIPLIRKTRVKVKIEKKNGLPFILNKYKKRKMFFIGIIICCCLIFILNMFIWDIKFEGNSKITDEVLLRYFTSINVRYGSFKYGIDSDRLEKNLREEYDDIIWASVEKKGTRLVVYIQESLLPDENNNTENTDEPKSIYATKNGIITKMVTRKGTPLVTVGSVVSEGSVLVDGKIDIIGDDEAVMETKLCQADADIYIQTDYDYCDSFELLHTEKKETGRKRNKYYIKFFSKAFNFYFEGKKLKNQESMTNEKQLKLWGDFYLPIYFGNIIETEYENYSIIYDDEGAKEIANGHLKQFCDELQRKGVQIIKKDVKITIDNNLCNAYGKIYVIEKNGEYK